LIALRAALWWCLALGLAPLLLPLAIHARRNALRLPDAGGPQQGFCPAKGEPLRLLLVGESTVAGVGVDSQQQALAGQLAEALAQRLARPVLWRACGENGITAKGACQRLLPLTQNWPADIVVLVLGVNDSTHLTTLRGWRSALQHLADGLGGSGVQFVFSGVPPLQDFSALPRLLRMVLGMRAALLDGVLREVASGHGALHCPLAVKLTGDALACDGYHPSVSGYRQWAVALADCITAQAVIAQVQGWR
jgi:lysophospholipase L1-like esterase